MYPKIKQDAKICLIANGCHENRNDAARIQEFFIQNGWSIVNDFKLADVIYFCACGSLEDSYLNSINIIKQLNDQKKPNAKLIICSCLTKINKDLIKKINQGPTFGPDEFEKLNEMFKPKIEAQHIHANFLVSYPNLMNKYERISMYIKDSGFFINIITWFTKIFLEKIHSKTSVVSNPNAFFIKVSTGCLSNCAFCSIRKTRGNLRSKPIEKIVEEFKEGLEKGYTEFGLIGTDVGSYGRDQGVNLAVLLKELINIKGDYKIKLRNINPKFLIEMMPELHKIFQSGKISYILTGMQSGNNRILKLMNRDYKIKDFKDTIKTINSKYPEIKIRTQVIVGYPSETKEEFKDTVRVLDNLTFDAVEVFMFNPRSNTIASKMEKQIPRKVAKRRYFKLYMKTIFNEIERNKKSRISIR